MTPLLVSDAPTLVVLFIVAMVAACFDAIAGGGGLITVPPIGFHNGIFGPNAYWFVSGAVAQK